MLCFLYYVTYPFQRKRKLSSGNFTCSFCLSPSETMVFGTTLYFWYGWLLLVRPLLYVTTVASKFPSARLRYKTSTCNEQRVLLDVARFCEHNAYILGPFFKYSAYKPNIKRSAVDWNMWTSNSRQIGRVAPAALSAIARYVLSEAAMCVLR